ncbi:phage baseplate assembly protein V [Aliiroseovarius crassostreae]|uniref:Gp5/Type VI secretion system Vgr protein OB-fold domain-containing protein n=1 Tax=Aliiroseovarius crassostreae TaxID=154981 RepID=A0A0P7KPG9_9RHOB|nr:phage baseplate assembly protein V [Aliiroseovarius crassostreae]KPN64255.1 hypothetical protein AKJ29_16605 [Aliiroseovarius crassostreae]SFU31044.1 phage baseplate assembly protein V [Aliiroseovarius crassostreae]
MADLATQIARIVGSIAELQRKQANVVRSGKVIEVDAANQRVKVDLGDNGSSFSTPWIPWTERAGARKTWNPPSVGELMTVLSPGGEINGNSLAVHGGFTDENAPPSANGDALAFSLGDVAVEVIGGGVTLTVGGVTLSITGAGLAINGGKVAHNGTDIGDTHKHSGVLSGPVQTGTPV